MLNDQITKDMVQAMKAGNKTAVGVLRMLKSDFKYKEIELKRELKEEDFQTVIASAVKKRREAIIEYEKGNRADLVAKESAELEILQKYLPEQLSDDELESIVGEAVAESNASNPSDIGAVMKAVMPKVKGRADGRKVNEIALRLLKD